MYGTIARLRVKRENLDKLRAEMEGIESRPVNGYVRSHVLTPDSGADEAWLVVFFEDRDSYHRNADDPAQHQDYLKMRALLEADPEWFDGEWETFEQA